MDSGGFSVQTRALRPGTFGQNLRTALRRRFLPHELFDPGVGLAAIHLGFPLVAADAAGVYGGSVVGVTRGDGKFQS